MSIKHTTTKYRTCHLCEAMCGLEIEVSNNEVVSIRGHQEDIYSKGHICPKGVALKDLQSRLATILAVKVDLPDENVLAAVMAKQFRDRGLTVPTAVIEYLLWRIERSFSAVHQVVEALDHQSLTEKRAITKRMAGQVLDTRGF